MICPCREFFIRIVFTIQGMVTLCVWSLLISFTPNSRYSVCKTKSTWTWQYIFWSKPLQIWPCKLYFVHRLGLFRFIYFLTAFLPSLCSHCMHFHTFLVYSPVNSPIILWIFNLLHHIALCRPTPLTIFPFPTAFHATLRYLHSFCRKDVVWVNLEVLFP